MELSSRFTRNSPPDRTVVRAGAFFILLVSIALSFASVWNDSIIIDEDPHIGAGYSYVVMQDMRLNPEHPPLAKALAGIPLLFLNLRHDAFQSSFWNQDINGQWEFGRRLMFNSGNNARAIAHVAKIAPILLFGLASWIIFYWTRQRYGNRAALLAMTLFAFSPTVMAHGRFVTTDVPAALGVLLATFFFIAYLKYPIRKNFWIAAAAFGIALLMKFSTILLIPLFILVTLVYSWKHVFKTALIMVVGFLIVVWPVYFALVWNYPPARQHRDTSELLKSYGNRTFADPVVWASDKPVLRAAAQYGLGLLMVVQRSAGGNTVYFRGNVTTSAGPAYFPFVYFIKEPLPWWGLVLIAVCALLMRIKNGTSRWHVNEWIKGHLDEVAMILWLAIYWATSINSTLNIGVRHLMPVYPFMIMLVSAQIAKLPKRMWYAVFILMAWYLFENIRYFPNYLSYFNQAVGGPSGGYRYVVDSNLDWGQDLQRFADWTENEGIKKIELNYFGWADQGYYLGDRFIWLSEDKYKDADDFLLRNQSDGWLAVSATYLQNNRLGKYRWLAERKPYAVVGNSIFIYRITP